MRRPLLKAAALLAAVLAIAAAATYAFLKRSLPDVSGSVSVRGISSPIDIVRDADDIPHIFAASTADALFGLGYVHAQDRLWQMEMQRRIGRGRLSEIFGAAAVPQDRFLRTVGFGRAAVEAWTRLPPVARESIDAYVAGVNAFIAAHRGALLPPEFQLLRFEPEPFTGVDVLAWAKMMAWDLSANYSFELLRRDLAERVGSVRAAELIPPYPRDGLSIVPFTESDGDHPDGRAAASHPAIQPCAACPAILPAFLSALTAGPRVVRDFLLDGARTEALGSNNWVVDGTMTITGKPMLANDPHLGTRLPSTWYLAHVSGGALDVIGATLPGTPAVALGRNRRIAWGATNVAADVQDLYRERLDPSGKLVEFRGGKEPVAHVAETIRVKGAEPVTLDVRVTRHGPLVSDAINANNAAAPAALRRPPLDPLAFRWTALDPDDTTIVAFLRLNQAANWSDFIAALRDLVVPSQNFVYADVDGHIGYYAPGRIPIRTSGDGASPANGWTGDAEWNGWVPFDALPHAFDPPSHFIVTANNRPSGPEYPYLLGLDWAEPYRALRIVERLRQIGRLSPADFAAIQADTFSLSAAALVPLLVARAHPQSSADGAALASIRAWNRDTRGDSAAAAIFEAWLQHLVPRLVEDDLGRATTENYQGRYSYTARFVAATLTADDQSWCDDVRTPARQTCDDVVTASLHDAVSDLAGRMGGDQHAWRWDEVHHAVFPHQGLDAVRLLRPVLGRTAPTGGDWSTVNVGAVAADHPYEQRSVAGYRQIIDLSSSGESRYLIDLGQSGHFLSPHYDDYLDEWQHVRYRKMRFARAEAEEGEIGRLTLKPQR